MKKLLFVIMALFTALCIAACSATPQQTPSASPSESESEAAAKTVTPTATATPSPSIVIEKTSITTGLPSEGDYHPISIMIENASACRPQTGLQQADVVYEALAEGNITRFMAIFNDTTPEVVGPVRSTRIYYINLQKEWDSIFVHYGGPSTSSKPSNVYGSSSKSIKVRVDGIKGAYNDYFWRDSSRQAPHNAYTNAQKILEKLYDYTPNTREPYLFDSSVSPSGETVKTISMPFASSDNSFVEYQYDAEKDKFIRYMDGEPFQCRTVTEGTDGKQEVVESPVEVQNVIVQYTKTGLFSNDIKGRRNIEVTGEGRAEFYVNGKHETGTWKRSELEDQTKFYLDDGSELVLRPGNTWIHLHPDNKEVITTYA